MRHCSYHIRRNFEPASIESLNLPLSLAASKPQVGALLSLKWGSVPFAFLQPSLRKSQPDRGERAPIGKCQVRMQSYGGSTECPSPLSFPLSFQGASRIITLHGSSDHADWLFLAWLTKHWCCVKGKSSLGAAHQVSITSLLQT